MEVCNRRIVHKVKKSITIFFQKKNDFKGGA